MSSLDGRTALVTAASSGLGYATARKLVEEGAEVFIGGFREDRVVAAAQAVGAAGHALADFTRAESTEAFADAALAALGHVDILVLNAGGPPAGRFLELTDEDWERAYRMILDTAIRLTRRVLPGMSERGFGRLIYLTSIGVIRPLPTLHLSNVMRAGVEALAGSLVTEVGPLGVTTHVLAPGHIDTDRRRQLTEQRAINRGVGVEEVNAQELSTVAVGRFGQAEELAELVAFLSSPKSGYLTGQTHRVDGGFGYAIPI